MSTSWKPISAVDATKHPLYGVKNWLAVFAFGILLGFLRDIAALDAEALKAGMSLSALLSIDHPAITFSKIGLAVDTAVLVVIYWLLFTKHPKFRLTATWLLLGAFPVVVVLGLLRPFDGLGEAVAMSLFPWAISCAVWVTYLNRSRRVRVTFEHLVRPDESSLPVVAQHDPPFIKASSLNPALRHADAPIAALPHTRTNPTHSDESLWARALAELEGQGRRPGLWARSFSAARGDEAVAKASYLGARVLELEGERQAAIAEQAQLANPKEERERLAKEAGNERTHSFEESIFENEWLEQGCSKEAIDYLKNPIHIYSYIQKYKKTEERILEAIKKGKLRGCYVSDALWVENKKI